MEMIEKGVELFSVQPPEQKILEEIRQLKSSLSKDLILLAHHYQRDEIVAIADITGDSLKLAQEAAAVKDKKYIVFAGVHFMAESADILTPPERIVMMPEPRAGCPLAEMADIAEVESVWRALRREVSGMIIPVTYINSTAAIKAFVGRNGGTVCTSGNAPKIFDWCLERGDKILFLPDRYLGENTARSKGILPEEIYHLTGNKLDPDFSKSIRNAKVLLWDGYCSVHRRFSVQDVENVRSRYPDIRVIVHPECTHEVVAASDDSGSTEKILNVVKNAPEGSSWAIGTEAHLVNRIRKMFPEKTVVQLNDPGYQCVTMTQTTSVKLRDVLFALNNNRIINRIHVDPETAKDAFYALKTMLEITG